MNDKMRKFWQKAATGVDVVLDLGMDTWAKDVAIEKLECGKQLI